MTGLSVTDYDVNVNHSLIVPGHLWGSSVGMDKESKLQCSIAVQYKML